MIWHHIGAVVLLAVATWQLELSARDNDLVTDLPGLDFKVSFRYYAGYLNVFDTKAFYYNFFEAQENAETAPLILWLIGGPGCSSIYASLNENGPFRIKDDSYFEIKTGQLGDKVIFTNRKFQLPRGDS